MPVSLIHMIMNDGSRHFGDLPQTVLWYQLRDHISHLDGATVTNFVTDGITEAWINFSYRGHKFSVNDQFGDYWFFVEHPECPDEILESILNHCQVPLGSDNRNGEKIR